MIVKQSKQKRKRHSQSKQGERKVQSIYKPTFVYPHQRTSSMHREKKELRFHTDYSEHDQYYTANIGNFTKIQKKNQFKRRDTFDIEQTQPKQISVHSTKYNPTKNLEIKSLFKKEECLKINKTRNSIGNHPLLKFIGKKNQREKAQSPYLNAQRHPSFSYHSSSINKPKSTSLTKKQQNFVLTKDQISLRAEPKEGTIKQQQTQKIEKAQVQVKGKNQKGRRQEQWTIKARNKTKQANQSVDSSESFGLTEEEEETFGDRFPYGFEKLKLLGRGGFSLVWLGKHAKSGREFAIKQIITQNTHQTHIKQIWFGTMFFTLGGVPKPQFSSFPGIKNLVRLYSYEINQTDTWIFYQKCGQSLGSALYDIRSEKIYGEQKLYKIHYKSLYQEMALRPKLLTQLVVQICRALALLSQCEIVHSDLKTENILLKLDKDRQGLQMREVKLIDYGSSFEFRNIAQFSMATPEYMPPQILNYIIHENEGEYEEQLYQRVMNNYKQPWAVDIWSLGCVILEIVVGVPLWMSLPLLVPGKNGSWLQKQGLFAVKGRLFPQIITKQRKVNPYIKNILEQQNYSRIVLSENMKKVVVRMLDIDFNKRISPKEIISILESQL